MAWRGRVSSDDGTGHRPSFPRSTGPAARPAEAQLLLGLRSVDVEGAKQIAQREYESVVVNCLAKCQGDSEGNSRCAALTCVGALLEHCIAGRSLAAGSREILQCVDTLLRARDAPLMELQLALRFFEEGRAAVVCQPQGETSKGPLLNFLMSQPAGRDVVTSAHASAAARAHEAAAALAIQDLEQLARRDLHEADMSVTFMRASLPNFLGVSDGLLQTGGALRLTEHQRRHVQGIVSRAWESVESKLAPVLQSCLSEGCALVSRAAQCGGRVSPQPRVDSADELVTLNFLQDTFGMTGLASSPALARAPARLAATVREFTRLAKRCYELSVYVLGQQPGLRHFLKAEPSRAELSSWCDREFLDALQSQGVAADTARMWQDALMSVATEHLAAHDRRGLEWIGEMVGQIGKGFYGGVDDAAGKAATQRLPPASPAEPVLRKFFEAPGELPRSRRALRCKGWRYTFSFCSSWEQAGNGTWGFAPGRKHGYR